MRFILPVAVLPTAAVAHHEAVVVSTLPALMVWLPALVAAGAAVGLWWRNRRK